LRSRAAKKRGRPSPPPQLSTLDSRLLYEHPLVLPQLTHA
jgi:hypothetical protein